jgi:hypothetical protein
VIDTFSTKLESSTKNKFGSGLKDFSKSLMGSSYIVDLPCGNLDFGNSLLKLKAKKRQRIKGISFMHPGINNLGEIVSSPSYFIGNSKSKEPSFFSSSHHEAIMGGSH